MFTGIVLAGGKSKRMGKPKALLELHCQKLIQYPLNLLKLFCSEIFVVTQTPELYQSIFLASSSEGGEKEPRIQILTDLYSEAGPMGGIFTGLESATNRWSIVLPCDMPYVRRELVAGLIALVGSQSFLEAIIPLGPDGVRNKISAQPLCAIYSKSCLPLFCKKIESQQLSLVTVLSELETWVVNWLELDAEDREGVSFTNVNTPTDYEGAKHNVPWRLVHKRAFC